jgi:sulfur carrier protein
MSAPAGVGVVVNGERRQLPAGATVEDVLCLLGAPPTGVAVAVNEDVLRRSEWRRSLADGDRVEVLTAAAGG